MKALLSPFELEFLAALNLLRTKPRDFASQMETFRQYYEGNEFKFPKEPIYRTREGVEAFDEALEFVRALKEMPPLTVASGLVLACQDHVADQSIPDAPTGHKGSDGSSPQTRATRYGDWGLLCGECINYGEREAFRGLMRLVIDDGIQGRGDRKNLTNSEFTVVGIAGGRHVKYGIMAVILLADRYTDDVEKAKARDIEIDKTYKKARKKGYLKDNDAIHVEKIVEYRPRKKTTCIII